MKRLQAYPMKIYLDSFTFDQIKLRAAERNISMSGLVKYAIVQYLAPSNELAENRKMVSTPEVPVIIPPLEGNSLFSPEEQAELDQVKQQREKEFSLMDDEDLKGI